MKHFPVLLLVLCAAPAIAGVPSGEFNYAFTNTPLWDVSGSYTNDIEAPTGVVVGVLEHFANGTVTGTRLETYNADVDNNWQGSGEIVGKASVKATGLTIQSKWSGTLTGVANGVSFVDNVTGKDTDVVIPSDLTLDGISSSARLCAVGGKCIMETPIVGPLPLPGGMTGDWTLGIDINTEANKITGSGTITLSNSREFDYIITGSFNAKSGVSKLKLIGTGGALGTSLSITAQDTNMVLTVLKGKLLGQKPTFP